MKSSELNKMSKSLVCCNEYDLKNTVGGTEYKTKHKTSEDSEKYFQDGGAALGMVAGAFVAYAWIKDVEKSRNIKELNIFSRLWRASISVFGIASVGGVIGKGIGHGVKKMNS